MTQIHIEGQLYHLSTYATARLGCPGKRYCIRLRRYTGVEGSRLIVCIRNMYLITPVLGVLSTVFIFMVTLLLVLRDAVAMETFKLNHGYENDTYYVKKGDINLGLLFSAHRQRLYQKETKRCIDTHIYIIYIMMILITMLF